MNAFAPRNYADERVCDDDDEEALQEEETHVLRVGRKQFHLQSTRSETELWYRRYENNGWQPLSVLNRSDSPRPREKSFRVVKSKQEIEEAKKRKRRDWMTKLYVDFNAFECCSLSYFFLHFVGT